MVPRRAIAATTKRTRTVVGTGSVTAAGVEAAVSVGGIVAAGLVAAGLVAAGLGVGVALGSGCGTRRAVDDVGVQRHRAGAGQRSAVDGRVGVECDGHIGEDRPLEARGRAERRGAADLPVDVARGRSVDEDHAAVGRRDQRGPGLEDEHGIGIALGVERERPGQPERGGRLVDAGREGRRRRDPRSPRWRASGRRRRCRRW